MILFNDFEPFVKVVWGASDTETFTYIDGVKVSENELKELGKIKPQAFFRQRATVRVWAWQFSDGKHFFVTNDFDEYIGIYNSIKDKMQSVNDWFGISSVEAKSDLGSTLEALDKGDKKSSK